MAAQSAAELAVFADWEREVWELRAAAYAAGVGRLTTGGVAPLLDAAQLGPASRLLDVATGPGFVAEVALARGCRVTAVDQSAAMVAIAARRLPGVQVLQACAERLGLATASYDGVVGGFLLNHLARPEVALAELVRVLAPGGRLALSVWDLPVVNRAVGLVGEFVTALGIRAAVPPGPDPARYADPESFTALLSTAGLTDVTVSRATWTMTVEPGPWFDTVAAGMPRSGAVLAQASDRERTAARADYVEHCLADYGVGDGLVTMPAAAFIGSGRAPQGRRVARQGAPA